MISEAQTIFNGRLQLLDQVQFLITEDGLREIIPNFDSENNIDDLCLLLFLKSYLGGFIAGAKNFHNEENPLGYHRITGELKSRGFGKTQEELATALNHLLPPHIRVATSHPTDILTHKSTVIADYISDIFRKTYRDGTPVDGDFQEDLVRKIRELKDTLAAGELLARDRKSSSAMTIARTKPAKEGIRAHVMQAACAAGGLTRGNYTADELHSMFGNVTRLHDWAAGDADSTILSANDLLRGLSKNILAARQNYALAMIDSYFKLSREDRLGDTGRELERLSLALLKDVALRDYETSQAGLVDKESRLEKLSQDVDSSFRGPKARAMYHRLKKEALSDYHTKQAIRSDAEMAREFKQLHAKYSQLFPKVRDHKGVETGLTELDMFYVQHINVGFTAQKTQMRQSANLYTKIFDTIKLQPEFIALGFTSDLSGADFLSYVNANPDKSFEVISSIMERFGDMEWEGVKYRDLPNKSVGQKNHLHYSMYHELKKLQIAAENPNSVEVALIAECSGKDDVAMVMALAKSSAKKQHRQHLPIIMPLVEHQKDMTRYAEIMLDITDNDEIMAYSYLANKGREFVQRPVNINTLQPMTNRDMRDAISSEEDKQAFDVKLQRVGTLVGEVLTLDMPASLGFGGMQAGSDLLRSGGSLAWLGEQVHNNFKKVATKEKGFYTQLFFGNGENLARSVGGLHYVHTLQGGGLVASAMAQSQLGEMRRSYAGLTPLGLQVFDKNKLTTIQWKVMALSNVGQRFYRSQHDEPYTKPTPYYNEFVTCSFSKALYDMLPREFETANSTTDRPAQRLQPGEKFSDDVRAIGLASGTRLDGLGHQNLQYGLTSMELFQDFSLKTFWNRSAQQATIYSAADSVLICDFTVALAHAYGKANGKKPSSVSVVIDSDNVTIDGKSFDIQNYASSASNLEEKIKAGGKDAAKLTADEMELVYIGHTCRMLQEHRKTEALVKSIYYPVAKEIDASVSKKTSLIDLVQVIDPVRADEIRDKQKAAKIVFREVADKFYNGSELAKKHSPLSEQVMRLGRFMGEVFVSAKSIHAALDRIDNPIKIVSERARRISRATQLESSNLRVAPGSF
jgi:hypothetical protein